MWYGGGKLAADLTLPKLRSRWGVAGPGSASFPGRGLSDVAARALLRNEVTQAADQAANETGFFAGLEAAGVMVRLRFSDTRPGPGHRLRGRPGWP